MAGIDPLQQVGQTEAKMDLRLPMDCRQKGEGVSYEMAENTE